VNLGPLSSFNNPTNALVLQVHAKNFNLIKAVCFQREWSVHTAMQEVCKRLQISEEGPSFLPPLSPHTTTVRPLRTD